MAAAAKGLGRVAAVYRGVKSPPLPGIQLLQISDCLFSLRLNLQ